MMKMVTKLRKLITRRSLEKETYTRTIAKLQKELDLMKERQELVLKNNKYWKKQAKKYKKLCIKLLRRQISEDS